MDLYFSVIKYRIYPIIPALFLILFPSYYSKNYSSIMCACLGRAQSGLLTALIECLNVLLEYFDF